MSDEWRTIDSARTGEAVRLGWWEENGSLTWHKDVGVPWIHVVWWRIRTGERVRSGDPRATHWMPLPDPNEIPRPGGA